MKRILKYDFLMLLKNPCDYVFLTLERRGLLHEMRVRAGCIFMFCSVLVSLLGQTKHLTNLYQFGRSVKGPTPPKNSENYLSIELCNT